MNILRKTPILGGPYLPPPPIVRFFSGSRPFLICSVRFWKTLHPHFVLRNIFMLPNSSYTLSPATSSCHITVVVVLPASNMRNERAAKNNEPAATRVIIHGISIHKIKLQRSVAFDQAVCIVCMWPAVLFITANSLSSYYRRFFPQKKVRIR